MEPGRRWSGRRSAALLGSALALGACGSGSSSPLATPTAPLSSSVARDTVSPTAPAAAAGHLQPQSSPLKVHHGKPHRRSRATVPQDHSEP